MRARFSRRTGATISRSIATASYIGAKIYLDAMPGGYEVVRRVLAHKRMDTTTRNYAGQETAAATRHFDSVILKHRTADVTMLPGLRRRGRGA